MGQQIPARQTAPSVRERLEAISLETSILCCAVIAVMVTSGIVGRSLGYPLLFADEYSSYLMATCVFFALPTVTSRREHLVADFLITKCTPAWQRRMRLIGDVILLAFLLALFAVAFRVVWVSYEDGLRSQGLMTTPMWIPQSAMFAGLLLASLSAASRVVESYLDLRRSSIAPTQEAK